MASIWNQKVTLKKLDDDDDDEKLEPPTTEVPKKYLLQCAFRNQNQAFFFDLEGEDGEIYIYIYMTYLYMIYLHNM